MKALGMRSVERCLQNYHYVSPHFKFKHFLMKGVCNEQKWIGNEMKANSMWAKGTTLKAQS